MRGGRGTLIQLQLENQTYIEQKNRTYKHASTCKDLVLYFNSNKKFLISSIQSQEIAYYKKSLLPKVSMLINLMMVPQRGSISLSHYNNFQ